MKYFGVFISLLLLSCAFGCEQKRVLLVGPEGENLINKFCVPGLVVTPLQDYHCSVNGNELTMINTPVFEDLQKFENTLHYIQSSSPINMVFFLWSANDLIPNSYSPYLPLAFALIPQILAKPAAFSLIVPRSEEDKGAEEYQTLTKALGLSGVVFVGKDWSVFDAVVLNINTSVSLGPTTTVTKEQNRFGGCLSSINTVQTRDGQKLIKDLVVGDEVLTPRGYSPVIFLEDHLFTTFPCVYYLGVWMTEDHFVYDIDTPVMARDIVNLTMTVDLEVRTVVVQGDSFFSNNVLVSSYSRFWWLPKISVVIDTLPSGVIRLYRLYYRYVLSYIF